jgi:hypothetical protein
LFNFLPSQVVALFLDHTKKLLKGVALLSRWSSLSFFALVFYVPGGKRGCSLTNISPGYRVWGSHIGGLDGLSLGWCC